ncbi:MAG: hypothetical protein H6632_07270 [Anaerolineales bacterium]|nr:hypothetical protein [Anaerolineales bacterium]
MRKAMPGYNKPKEQAITNGAKVLLLVNPDSGRGAAIIAQAREAGAKVIDATG